MRKLGFYVNIGLLLLRIGIGIMFILIGSPKFLGGPEQWEITGVDAAYIGITAWPMLWGFIIAIAEFFGGILIILGLLFRPAIILLFLSSVVTIASAIGQSADFTYTANAFSIGFVFLSMFFTGAGQYSLDQTIWTRRQLRRSL